jgi:branched-chain amino acid transport system substrate-binding protein
MKRTLLSIGLVLTLLTTFACQQRSEVEKAGGPVNDTGNIRVGIYVDLSGQNAGAGQSIKNGAELAKDEINQAGGINGRQIELIVEDDRGVADESANAVGKLISQKHVHALIGGDDTPNALAAAQKAQGAKVPLIAPASTDPKLTQTGDYIFRACVLDSFQSETMAKYALNNVQAKTAVVLFDTGSDYSRGLAQSFEENFKKLGGQVLQKQSYAQSDKDFKEQLTAIRDANPDAVYIPGRGDQIGLIAKQAKQLDIKAILLGDDGWNDPQVFQTGGAALDGAYITGHYSAADPSLPIRKFNSAYSQRYGKQPDANAALAYDALKILADAFQRAGTSEGPKLRDAIAQTVNFQGQTGSISFNAERNVVKPAVIFKLQDGKAFPVYREEAQSVGTQP